jgi:hypothetical protein
VTYKDSGNLTVSETFSLQFVSGPAVQSFTVTDNSGDPNYGKAGDALTFVVTFTERIVVTGTLTATFTVGTTEVVASYTGSGTGTVSPYALTFNATTVTVPANENGKFTLKSLTGTAVNANSKPLTPVTNGTMVYDDYIVDNTAPLAPTLTLIFDNGSSASDGITNNGTVNVEGLESGSKWQYCTSANGAWSALQNTGSSNTFELGEGEYSNGSVQVRVYDQASNSTTTTWNKALKIDKTNPSSPYLSLNADTGSNNTDGVTRDGQFNVVFSQDTTNWEYSTELDNLGQIQWVAGSTLLSGTTDNTATFTLVTNKTYAQGAINVRAYDKAGNSSAVTYGKAITFDTQAPTVEEFRLNQDTGKNNGDGVTNEGLMNIKFSADTVKWQYTTDGGNVWSAFFTPTAISGSTTSTAGSFNLIAATYDANVVKVRSYDLAGNETTTTNPSKIVVDKTNPNAPNVALVLDSGFNNADWITSNGAIKISGLEVGSQWEYSTDGGSNWENPIESNAQGEGSLTLTASLGQNKLQVRTRDLAGNLSAVKNISSAITIDTTAPTIVGTGALFSLAYTEKARAPGAAQNSSAGNSVGETQALTIAFDSPVYGLSTTAPNVAPLTSTGVFKVGNTAVSATWSGIEGGTTRTLTYTIAEGENGEVTIDSAALKSILTKAQTGLKDAAGNVFTYADDFPTITGMPAVDTTAPTQDIRTALVLDKAQNQYVKLPALSAAALGGDLTLEAWVYANGDQSNWARIFDFSSGTDGANSIWLGFKDGKIRFESSDAQGTSSVSTTSSLAVNSWQHVAVTVGSDGKAITIFINGNAAGTGTLASSVTDVARGNNYIGKSSFSIDPYFNGRIADARVYNDARTQAEIKSDMTGAMSGDQLVMSYKFNGTANSSGGSISQSAELTSVGSAPTFVNQVKLSADTGINDTDCITNTANQTLTGKYLGTLASDENIYVSVDGGTTWLSTKATTNNANGTWSLNNVTLLTGTNTIVAKIVDNAGNENPYQTSQTYTLAVNSAAPVIDLDSKTAGSDSAASRRGEIYMPGKFFTGIELVNSQAKSTFTLKANNGFTLETWLKSTGQNNDGARIFSMEDPAKSGQAGSPEDCWLSTDRQGNLIFGVGVNGVQTYTLATNVIKTEQWQHVALKYLKTPSAAETSGPVTVLVYVDGVMVGSANVDAIGLNGEAKVQIAGRTGDFESNNVGYNGSFADTRVYDIARSQDQIRSDMGGSLDVADPNLLNSFQFNGSLAGDKNSVSALRFTNEIQLLCGGTPTSLNGNSSATVSASTLKAVTVKVSNLTDSSFQDYVNGATGDLIYVGTTALQFNQLQPIKTGTITLFGKTWDYAWSLDLQQPVTAGTINFTSGTSFTGEEAQALINQLAYSNGKGTNATGTDRTFAITVTDIAGNVSNAAVATVKVNNATPLMLDLNGDGVHTTAMAQGVLFDVTHSGQPVKTGWVDANDGLLARDLNHDGQIQNGSELFGNGTDTASGKAADGYAALRQFDLNADGVINAQDAIFNELLVWTDRNGDGVSNAGELHSLASLGIASLNLNAVQGTQKDQGNTLGLVSSWTDTQGKTHAMADVWFDTTSLQDLVKQATGSQKIDLAKDSAANTVDLTLAQVLQTEQKLVVVKADANDVVRIDHEGWVNTGSTTVVDNHSYALWSNSTAHLLIDQNAKVQAVI